MEERVRTVCLLVLTFIAVGFALYFLRVVLVPLVLAGFFRVLLEPALDLLHRRLRLPRGIALVLTLLLGVGVLFVIGALVAGSVAELADKGDQYGARAQELVDSVTGWFPFERLRLDPDSLLDDAKAWAGEKFLAAVSGLQGLVSDGLLVLLFLLFLVLGQSARKPGIAGEVEGSVRKYLSIKFILSALTGVLVGTVFTILRVDLALVWGVLTFLLNFIPNIGSVIAVILPTPIILMDPALGPTARVLALALPAALQFGIGNVLEPRIMGTSVDLHPIVVLAALVFWGMLWGVAGALLAVPLTATLRIFLERYEMTRPVANVLTGRW